jgi:hypothetical protein
LAYVVPIVSVRFLFSVFSLFFFFSFFFSVLLMNSLTLSLFLSFFLIICFYGLKVARSPYACVVFHGYIIQPFSLPYVNLVCADDT